MARIVRLTENEMTNLVRKIINEQVTPTPSPVGTTTFSDTPEDLKKFLISKLGDKASKAQIGPKVRGVYSVKTNNYTTIMMKYENGTFRKVTGYEVSGEAKEKIWTISKSLKSKGVNKEEISKVHDFLNSVSDDTTPVDKNNWDDAARRLPELPSYDTLMALYWFIS